MGVILGGDIFFIFLYFIYLTLGRCSLLVFAWSSIFIIVTVFFGECQGLCALTFAMALVLKCDATSELHFKLYFHYHLNPAFHLPIWVVLVG